MSRWNRPADDPAGVKDQSLEALYRRYAGWLTARLRRRFGAAMAEDLTQETYLRIAGIPAEEIAHPKALLMRTAVNLGYDQARFHARRAGITRVLAQCDAADIDIADPASQGEGLTLKQIILDLPPLYRDVFLLSRFEGLTYEQIADHLGVAVVTVERRMAKALAICAAHLRD